MTGLGRYSAPIVRVYESLVDELMVNIARHFNVKVTGNTAGFGWEVQKLAELGQLTQENAAIIARRVADNEPMIKLALETAMLDALQAAEPTLAAAARAGLLNGTEQTLSGSIAAKLEAYSRQAARQINLVNTVMLDGTLNAYRKVVSDTTRIMKQLEAAQGILNAETSKVVTGRVSGANRAPEIAGGDEARSLRRAAGQAATVSTRQEAVRKAIRDMADTGLTGFIDRGGHHWSPEAYVAMDIGTTCGNAATQAVFDRNIEYGNDLVWVPINATARPGCYPWQGKVISMGGRSGSVIDLDGHAIPVYSVGQTTYGQPDGLWGIYCHHKPPNVFVPGISQIRGKAPDKAGNDARYAISQQQRRLEREVRYAKRDAAMMDALGDKEAFDAAALKVKRTQGELKAFAGANGLPVYGDRTQVFGYNRSVSGKVRGSAQRQEATARAARAAADDAKTAKIASIREQIRSDTTPKTVNAGHQNKHIPGSPGYIDGRSYIYGDLQTAQSLVNQYHGTGEIRLRDNGDWSNKEFVTLDHDMGVYRNIDGNEQSPTNTFSIHYGKKGTHIVPARRKDHD